MKGLWAEKYDSVSAGINEETIAEDNVRKIHNASDFCMTVRYDYTQEKGEILLIMLSACPGAEKQSSNFRMEYLAGSSVDFPPGNTIDCTYSEEED